MPDSRRPVQYLRDVDTLLVAGTTVAGFVIGAVLDPVGQREADRSRAEDERRRAERIAEEESVLSETGASAEPHSALEHLEHFEETVGDALSSADADDADDPTPVDRTVANLVPSGVVPARTAVAAVVTAALFGAAAVHWPRTACSWPCWWRCRSPTSPTGWCRAG